MALSSSVWRGSPSSSSRRSRTRLVRRQRPRGRAARNETDASSDRLADPHLVGVVVVAATAVPAGNDFHAHEPCRTDELPESAITLGGDAEVLTLDGLVVATARGAAARVLLVGVAGI